MSLQVMPPDVDKVLRGLKDFQRDSVEYVFRRLYLDHDATRRFLIADEVGLGKTLVARGLIARIIDHLWKKVSRVDVVYICSNADIARQNINRLKIGDQEDFALASRITLLPTLLHDLKSNKLNFISFTPGTSFDLRSSLGMVGERALLYWLLDHAWSLRSAGPLNVLQGNASKNSFRWHVDSFKDNHEIDPTLADAFADALARRIKIEQEAGQADLRSRFDALCRRFAYARKHLPPADAALRTGIVGELRALLAATCINALEPDLIILDEFQRFKHLLDGRDVASELARGLFEYPGARVLLLSATPYKMYTLTHEAADDDHYKDFVRTFNFLQPDATEAQRFERLLREYRRELYRLGDGGGERLPDLKRELEAGLRRVMVRTERLAVTTDRDGMLEQIPAQSLRLEPGDFASYVALQKVAHLLDNNDTLEYWKSAPYLLNFMDDYELKQDFQKALSDPQKAMALAAVLASAEGLLLDWRDISTYAEVDPANARLRALIADVVDVGAWRLLWMPPSLPYYQPGGPFAEPSLQRLTKRLVFSAWRVVPKVISTLVSYEVERRMMRSFPDEASENTSEARRRWTPLLRFARADGRLTGMPVLGLLYPSITLARECDPLVLAAGRDSSGALPSAGDVLERARRRIDELLSALPVRRESSGADDEAWYWAAPMLLDLTHDAQKTRDWLTQLDLAARWSEDTGRDENGGASAFAEHVARARELVDGQLKLGRPPSDLITVLAQMAIAGPGIVALRALSRVSGGSSMLADGQVKDGAARVAWSLHRLFNLPEVTAMVRGLNSAEPYWRRVLEYCVDGGLQSTFDEYAHILRDTLGLVDKSLEATVSSITSAMCKALTLRTASLRVDEVIPRLCALSVQDRGMRARFALRFGEERTDGGVEVTRADQVREAFNSPFWPFVIATTSVGQEGLDFHPYCHAVVHWNLPANPVDLEQREGRVHRYKGHAVRRNLALRHGTQALRQSDGDPWERLFDLAKRERDPDESDLVPFWVFYVEGGAKIERHVPALPLSREIDRLSALRRSLAVYRMVFGQPRQDELLAFLLGRLPEVEIVRVASELRIDLSPPRSGVIVS